MYIKLFFIFLLATVSGCDVTKFKEERKKTMEWMLSNGRIKALCTTVFVEFLVRGVGGDHVDVLRLIPSESDPHAYRLVKGDSEKFFRADVCFNSGLGLETSFSLNKQLKNHNSVAVADEIAKETPCILLSGIPDPHMWMDVSLWARGAKIVAKKLAEIDAKHKSEYFENAERVENELKIIHQRIFEKMMSIPEEKRYLVTTHDAFHYFARAYLTTPVDRDNGEWKQRIFAPEGLAPESEISLQTIREVVSYIKKHLVKVVFVEFAINYDSVKKIVQACGGVMLGQDPLYSDSILSSMTYEQAMEHNAIVISSAILVNV